MTAANASAQRLEAVLAAVLPTLGGVDDAAATRSPGAGIWSPKQVLGHLVDSAAVNHQRFLRAAANDELVFPTYDQEEWVRLQACEGLPWLHLLELWAAYNRHLAWVIERIPTEARRRLRARHNLHQIAWRKVAAETPVTLEYLIVDYVGHLENHIRQIHERVGLALPAAIRERESPPPSSFCGPGTG